MAAVLTEAPAPTLTPAHRAWLDDPARRSMLCRDFVLEFLRTFDLNPHVAGRLLAAWARELA